MDREARMTNISRGNHVGITGWFNTVILKYFWSSFYFFHFCILLPGREDRSMGKILSLKERILGGIFFQVSEFHLYLPVDSGGDLEWMAFEKWNMLVYAT